MSVHGLRVLEGGQCIDEESGEVYVQSSELAEVKQHLREAEEALRLERAKVTKLKREKAELQEADPDGPVILDVLAHWKATGHPNAAIPLTGRRAAAVRKALKNFTADELKMAATGCAKFPWESYGRHYCEQGPKSEGREKRDDATYVFANNEKRIEYLISLAKEDPGHDEYAKWLAAECQRNPVLKRALAGLALAREPHGEVIVRCAIWAARSKASRLDVARGKVLAPRTEGQAT